MDMSTEELEFVVKFRLSSGDNFIVGIEIYDNLICYFNYGLMNSYYDLLNIFKENMQDLEEMNYESFTCDFYHRTMFGNKEKLNIEKDELENFLADVNNSIIPLTEREFIESNIFRYLKPFVESLKDHVI